MDTYHFREVFHVPLISPRKQILSSWTRMAIGDPVIRFSFQETNWKKKMRIKWHPFSFMKSTLLSYKFHKIKCTYFKCSAQWILAYVYGCVSTTTINILNISITPKSSLMPHQLATSTPVQSKYWSDYRIVSPILEFHTNGTTRYVLFCVWLLFHVTVLRFINSSCVLGICSFLLLNSILFLSCSIYNPQ